VLKRPRRLRENPVLREMVQETRLSLKNLIYPLFVRPGRGIKEEIPSMPGQFRYSVDMLIREVEEAFRLGISAILLFGIPERKDEIGSEAWNPQGIVQRAIGAIKERLPEVLVITDVCLCEYTSHGHCGIPKGSRILNDPTLELLALTALSHVRAGADMVAPSDMMDGRVRAIREALDREGYSHIPIMAYSAKYASCFYGPFREAAESQPKFGNRASYQMDPPNAREALKEMSLDVEEGADILMVKPALPYLDIIRLARERFDLPIAAYCVSGEYAMIKAASSLGFLDEKKAIYEVHTAIKRAGADLIITYFAKDLAKVMG
jgi:porphobilinogen synthase